jgi:signal transduction histidine kinase
MRTSMKNKFMLKELLPIFGLLLLSILIPAGGMVWFMTAAMHNEQLAVRQRLTDVYESQLDTAANHVEETVAQWQTQLEGYAELPPAERFEALVRESFSDSILVLDDQENLAYPSERASMTTPDERTSQTRIRELIRSGAFEEAHHAMQTLDAKSRSILPALQLFHLQSVTNPSSPEIMQSLRDAMLDYRVDLSSARRVFYLRELSRLGLDVEPLLSAESMVADQCEELAGWSALGLYLLRSDASHAVAVFRRSSLAERLQPHSSVKGVRIELRERGENGSQAALTKPMLALGDAWELSLVVDDDDPLAAGVAQRTIHYVWIGCIVLGLMGVLFGLLVRSLLTQQRLARMKNDFVATVTHELKTPLASTRMLVDTLLEGRCKSETQQREYLELIARENKRLSRLIDNFLTFSRMERNKQTFSFATVDPVVLVQTAEAAVRERFERLNCALSVETKDGLPSIRVDEDAMITVLLNLLDNAFKYSEEDKRIELRVFAEDQSVCFQVQDHGIGLEKREQSKILERFYQVDQSLTRKVGGAGLGLSIVRFILDAHKGTIHIESEPGAGSCFTVQIPIVGENDGE